MPQLNDEMATIVVPERGGTIVSATDWARLSIDPNFWELCRSKIISVDLTTRGQHKLAGNCYTGEVWLESFRLVLAEKFPGATDVLLAARQRAKRKKVQLAGFGDEHYDPIAALVGRYLSAVKTYLSGFRKVQYIDRTLTGTLAGGRLDVRGTIKLRISGKGHRLAYRKSQVSSELPYNVCLYAALKQVERLNRIVQLQSSLIVMARALRAPLSDCESQATLLGLSQIQKLATEQAKAHSNSRSELALPIELASLLLEATPQEFNESERHGARNSWFVNLENLFEAAVRECIKRLLGEGYSVTSSRKRPDLFKPDLGRYRANPDVVVRTQNGNSVMIADAKYKDIDLWPSASDVHELLAHAAGFFSPKAVIFYPSDADYMTREFGMSVTGCHVLAAGIRFGQFEEDVRRTLVIMGVLKDAHMTADGS